MRVVTHLNQIPRGELGAIAFVPTMGALHGGHAQLIKTAKQFSDDVLVSIFVNPLQFNDANDLAKYPRTPELDADIAADAGARVLWIPEFAEIYPTSREVERIPAGSVGSIYEGAARAGHFEGVLTVVKRLFDLVSPTWAFFGEKDFQQLFLIKSMVKEFNLRIEIVAVPTVRESDGLAISSRNVRLSQTDRQNALVISRALRDASLETTVSSMQHALDSTLAEVPEFKPDYAAIIDEDDFTVAHDQTVRKRAIVAGWINGVRLIDNMTMTGASK